MPNRAEPRSRHALRLVAEPLHRLRPPLHVLLAPILPRLSDHPERLAETVRAARAAGAQHVWANLLYLRPGTREHFLEALGRDWPEERERYEVLYAGRSYLTDRHVRPVRELVRELARETGPTPHRSLRPPPEPEQLRLIA